jgi:hypothetical protein
MRLTAKPVIFGVPALLLAAALIAALALWAWNGSGGRGTEGTRVVANVEYTVRDAAGNVKDHGFFHNAATRHLLGDARTRLSTAVAADALNTYDDVALCTTNVSGATPAEGFLGVACVALSANVANPDLNNGVTDGGTSTPTYAITANYTATAASVIREIQLVKGAVASTIPVLTTVGAARAVTIDLANTDTLAITWTISFAGS